MTPKNFGEKQKPFYRRKRLWILLILLGLLALPWAINPIKTFRKTVTWTLNIRGIEEHLVASPPYLIHYYEGGTEHPQTVILLHGFGGNALLTWMQLLPALAKKYHVIAPDLLASNFMRLNPHTYSIDQEVKLVMGLMEEMRIQKPSLVGLSVGGWIALLIAAEHPDRVAKLILVESAGLKTEIPELARLSLTDREKVRYFLKLLFHYPPPLPGFVLDQMVRSSGRVREKYQAVFTGFIENSKGRVLDGTLQNIPHPTLILHGRQDQVIPLELGERLHQGLPNSEFIVLENSGHGAVWDSPRLLKKYILEFLAK